MPDSLDSNNDKRFLDEIYADQYSSSSLYGDAKIEDESRLPAYDIEAEPYSGDVVIPQPVAMSLAGEWLMNDSAPSVPEPEHFKRGDMFKSPGYSEGVQAGWEKPETDRAAWRKVNVPTTVQSALLKLGEIPDPFWNTNTYDELMEHGKPDLPGTICQALELNKEWNEQGEFIDPDNFPWHYRKTRIEQKEWWFAKKFTLPESFSGRNVRLCFDGIDYSGSVYINGKSLGGHEGMFGGPVRDISASVCPDQNEVVVRLDEARFMWHGRPKGNPGWGWHYGHLISTGIWQDVRVEAIPDIEVQSPFVITKSFDGGSAVLDIEYYIVSSKPGITPVTVKGSIRGKNFESEIIGFKNELSVPYGTTRYRTQVSISNPRLWWPMNYGAQDMHALEIVAEVAGAAIDGKSTSFGIRTVEMRAATDAIAGEHYKWQFVINGVPMFIKGANWCYMDPMLEQDPAKYKRMMELARRAGIQMFRAWGGGIIETELFYRLCDEMGIMVYQEFPYTWWTPTFPETNPLTNDQQVTTVVKRLRNHPSLVMWGGSNETMQFMPGGDEVHTLIGKRCMQYDPSRPFHRTDPHGGSVHNWNVYHNSASFDESYMADRSPFYGEYGFPSMTNMSSTLKYLPADALKNWPPTLDDHAVMAHMHQFSTSDLAKVIKYVDYGPVRDWETYTEYSQMAQGDWLRFAAEGQRARSGESKTGFWYYKLSDLFPGHSWAVVDYYCTPKLSYYRARQTCLPQCAFAFTEKLNWEPGEQFVSEIHLACRPLSSVHSTKCSL